MKKRAWHLLPRGGFTLVEVIITVAISSIILAGTTLLLVPTLNVYAQANDLAELNGLCDNLADELSAELRRIDQPPAIVSGDPSDSITLQRGSVTIQYSVVDGVLHKKVDDSRSAPFVPAKAYKGKTVDVSCTYTDRDATNPTALVTIDLRLTTANGGTLDRQIVVSPILLNQRQP